MFVAKFNIEKHHNKNNNQKKISKSYSIYNSVSSPQMQNNSNSCNKRRLTEYYAILPVWYNVFGSLAKCKYHQKPSVTINQCTVTYGVWKKLQQHYVHMVTQTNLDIFSLY